MYKLIWVNCQLISSENEV